MLYLRLIKFISGLLVISTMLIASSNTFAVSPTKSSASVLRFQQKMANKGLPEAQFKLAMMYESGIGIKADIEQAKTWYNKAAYQNFKPAKNRLIYLDIKYTGFKESHNFWIKDLRHDALYGDGEALFLLGAMYTDGTGVKQDLKKAVRILKKASASNIPGSELQLARAEKAYSEEKKRHALIVRKQKQKQKKLTLIKELRERKTQQHDVDEKKRLIEQRIIEQQRRQFAETYKQLEQNKVKKKKTVIAKPKNRKELVTENTEYNVCSGKNRFVATCR
jgi:Sel1 repeat